MHYYLYTHRIRGIKALTFASTAITAAFYVCTMPLYYYVQCPVAYIYIVYSVRVRFVPIFIYERIHLYGLIIILLIFKSIILLLRLAVVLLHFFSVSYGKVRFIRNSTSISRAQWTAVRLKDGFCVRYSYYFVDNVLINAEGVKIMFSKSVLQIEVVNF